MRVFLPERAAFVASSLAHLLRLGESLNVAILAYVFMPDHVHVLFDGTHEGADIREHVRRWKLRVGFEWRHAVAAGHPLWQRGYYDYVLRAEDELGSVVRYMVMNPVRAGLVVHPSEYPFTKSQVVSVDDLVEHGQMWSPPARRQS